MKKRHYNFTPEEREQHDMAVKIRRMTDEQLVQYIANIKDEAYEQGLKTHGKIEECSDKCFEQQNVSEFISSLRPGNGIGPATIAKLREFAIKQNLILPF